MLAIGGTFPADNSHCDSEEVWGVHNIDLGNQIKSNFKQVWAGYEPTLFGYKVPSFVTSVIGGTKDGGATKVKPESGFVNHDLGTLLGMKAAFSTRTRWSDGRSDPATATLTRNSGPRSGLSTGAIVGIAVGGAIVLLAVLVGLWLIRRRRKERPNVQLIATAEPVLPVTYSPPSFNPSYYNQSPDSGQRRSPWSQDNDWEHSEQNQVWRPPLVNLQPSELDGQSFNFRETRRGV